MFIRPKIKLKKMEFLMLKKCLNLILLLSFAAPIVVNASGTFITFPPKPKTVDCSLPENADKEECKKK